MVAKVVTSAMSTSIANSVGRDDAQIEADVEHDQLHQPARVHQDAQRRRVAPAEAGEPRGDEAAPELADAGDER